MSLSAKFIQHLRNKDTKSRRKLSECNADLSIDWDRDLISRWISNSCLECHNQECGLLRILKLENLQSGNRRAYEVKEFVIESLTETLCNVSLINDELKNETTTFFGNVYHGCNWILSNNEMQSYFKSNIKHLTIFVKSFLEFQTHISKSSSEIKFNAQYSLSNTIDSYLEIYQQFSDKELFVTEFLNSILFSLCNLMKFEKLNVQQDLQRCIQILLFTKNFLPQYKKFNNESEGIPATLFSILEKIVNIDLDTALTIFDVIFCVAVKSYESDTKVLDVLFRNIVKCANREKLIIKKLLDRLIGIHLNLDNQIDDVKLSDYLITFVDEILKEEHFESLDYDLISRIVDIHPFILETNFENILVKLVPKYLNVSENSYSAFFVTILKVSVSLRIEHKLISRLLAAVKSLISENSQADILITLPGEFLTKFMESIENTTVSQTRTILKSLIFYLKPYCEIDSLPNSSLIILQVIFQLVVSFMKGIKIFCIKTLNTQEKFCDDLVELGNQFSAISREILNNEKIIFSFVNACQAWNDVCNLIIHYFPSISEKLNCLSRKKLIKLLKKVENLADENEGNVFSQNLLMNLTNEERIIETLNCQSSFWISVVQNNSEMLFNLSDRQLCEIAEIAVSDILDNSDNWQKWEKCKDNSRFVSALVNQILIKSENNVKSEATIQLIGKITKDFKWKKVISKIQKGTLMGDRLEFLKNSTSKDCKIMKEFFKILSSMHLSHLHRDIRIVLFILISSISLEFSRDIEMAEKCNEILLDLLQERDINIFQFPNLQILHENLLGNDVLSRLFELPLNDSFNSVINVLDSNDIGDNVKIIVLNIVLKTKLHKKSEEIQLLKNLIEKWNNLPKNEEIRCTIELVLLVFSLKDAIINRNITDELKETTNRILSEIFEKNLKINDEYVQLLELVLRNRSFLEVTNANISLITKAILFNPNEYVLRPFLETLNSDEFSPLLKTLQKQTLHSFGDETANELKKCLLIWEYVIIIEMASTRNHTRLVAINNLLFSLDENCISANHWLCLIKLFETIVSSKFIQITGQIIDLILLSCMKCMKRVGVVACREIVGLYTKIVKLRTNFVKNKLYLLVQLNSEIMRILSDETTKLNCSNDQYRLECLILDLEKFVIALKKFGDGVAEIYPFMLNDLVEWYCHQLLPKNLKNPLELVIQHLLSHCEHEKIEFLNRIMPVTTQKIFKELVTMYRKHYKFTGKI